MGGIRPQVANPDAAVARIAAKQHGIITFTQLIDAGLSPSQVRNRVRSGRLHRIHRGVYAVGHRGLEPPRALDGGGVARAARAPSLSHRAAAELWQLLDRLPRRYRHHRSRPRRSASGAAACASTAPTCPSTRSTDARRHRRHHPRPHARATCAASSPPEIYRRALRQAEFKGMDLAGLETDGTRSELESDVPSASAAVIACPRPRSTQRDRPLHRRLPLAPRAARRRGRRLGCPPGPADVRGRPRARPGPAAPRATGFCGSPLARSNPIRRPSPRLVRD